MCGHPAGVPLQQATRRATCGKGIALAHIAPQRTHLSRCALSTRTHAANPWALLASSRYPSPGTLLSTSCQVSDSRLRISKLNVVYPRVPQDLYGLLVFLKLEPLP